MWRALSVCVLVACGDPLLDGHDPGPPTLVLDTRVLGLDPTDDNRPAAAAVVWTTPIDAAATYERQPVTLVPADVGDFQLQVFGAPGSESRALFGPAPGAGDTRVGALALGFMAVLDEGPSGEVDERDLDAMVRGASADHYLLWVHEPTVVAPWVRDLVINPDALTEGMNLVIGLCRPGRPSQLLVVPPERVTITARDDIVAGACLDVFWGDWRR